MTCSLVLRGDQIAAVATYSGGFANPANPRDARALLRLRPGLDLTTRNSYTQPVLQVGVSDTFSPVVERRTSTSLPGNDGDLAWALARRDPV